MAANKTLQTKKLLIEAMEQSLGVVTQACKTVGVSRVTYYDYYNSDPEFKKAIDELQNVALDFAESQLHKQIKQGSTSATIFYLKTKGKNRGYIERQEIQHDTDTGFNITIVDAARD
jgi:hypothetical protein